ncbi:MAG: hypothetical protein UX45_C0024G0006 [Candidatus Uhrbacteria bacterium GW2011_GWF2_46_218]|uniref:HD domain-containing protein n=2 Tax=Candidatus Uhriibacteriota TaxID=1752732 RepID=A0A0G1SF75_9BACT|nr:MAG: hypothetical protein UX45_C0024G0006 [Candidatus Uhrbacteria bacterium GW2011_GWF2_46_218]
MKKFSNDSKNNMNKGNISLENTFEKAVRLLCQYIPIEKNRKKPLLMHDLRVGLYLYEQDHVEEVVLAGLLHDIIEWTDCTEECIQNAFGPRVLALILANTKDRKILDEVDRQQDIMRRCLLIGEDAFIVKAADTLDSYSFYRSTHNQEEIQRALLISKMILESIPSTMQNPIFKKLVELECF